MAIKSSWAWRFVGEDRAWTQLTGAATVTLQYCLNRYQQCNQLITRAVRIIWDLTFATILILYKLVVISYRLTVGMRRTEESTVPDLIRSNNYKVRTD